MGNFYRRRNFADARVGHLLLTNGRGNSGCASIGSYKAFLGRVCRAIGKALPTSALPGTSTVCCRLGVRRHGGGVPTRLPRNINATGGANRLSAMRGSTTVVCSATGKVSLMMYFVSRSLASANTTRDAVTTSTHTVCKCCGRWARSSRSAICPSGYRGSSECSRPPRIACLVQLGRKNASLGKLYLLLRVRRRRSSVSRSLPLLLSLVGIPRPFIPCPTPTMRLLVPLYLFDFPLFVKLLPCLQGCYRQAIYRGTRRGRAFM